MTISDALDASVDPAIAAAYARSLRRAGVPITIQRVTGEPPNTALVSARVKAMIYDRGGAPADTRGYGAGEPGAITESGRWAVVLLADLRRARFPLPVAEDDKILLPGQSTKLTITNVDPLRRAKAGALEIRAEGL